MAVDAMHAQGTPVLYIDNYLPTLALISCDKDGLQVGLAVHHNYHPMLLWSWNINGIRASIRKGFLEVLHHEQPDVVFLQEIKAQVDQLSDDILEHEHYRAFWYPAERKGYSGVALLTKQEPDHVHYGTGVEEFDQEGRVIAAEFGDVIVYGIYFPNGGRGGDRLEYKYRFYDHMLEVFEQKRKEGKKVIVCGDYNVAHEEIDLARPKQNVNTSGFLAEERAWFTKLLTHGYIDTFRHFHPDQGDQYSWWDQRFKSRDRNVGWRIDYFVVSEEALPLVVSAGIRQDILGSDHCPVTLTLNIS